MFKLVKKALVSKFTKYSFQSDENLDEYLHEEFVDEDEHSSSYDVFATLPKTKTSTTTIMNDVNFDLSSTQTLPRSYKVKSDERGVPMTSSGPKNVFSKTTPRSQSVGELSLEHRERGRVQVKL
jgi:hypothetical protein